MEGSAPMEECLEIDDLDEMDDIERLFEIERRVAEMRGGPTNLRCGICGERREVREGPRRVEWIHQHNCPAALLVEG